MENILITIFLYIATFYVLCDFAKTKSTTTSTIDTTTTQVLDVVTDQDDIFPTATTDHTGDIEPIAIIETTKPATGHILNSQALAGIFEDRDVNPDIKHQTKKRKPKKNISGFIREINALTKT